MLMRQSRRWHSAHVLAWLDARQHAKPEAHAGTCVQEPEASSEGLGGTYIFMDEAGRRAAIVKPCDEEPLAPNNPKACDA